VAVTTLRSRSTIAAIALLVPVLAGCSNSFDVQTDQVYTPARGVSDRSGPVDVLNALVVSAENGAGTIVTTLVNNDTEDDDTLVSVTVDGAPATVSTEDDAAVIPAGGHTDLGTSGAVFASSGAIVAGKFVDLIFTFQHGGAITVEAPVIPHEGAYADVPLNQAD
jgi:hypothetical protein